MKKERLIVKCSIEDFYNALVYDFKNQYLNLKGKILDDEEIVKGFSFTHKLPMKKRDTVANKAKYKIRECEPLQIFVLEYTSKTYHKVISTEIKKINEDSTEILFGSFDEKLKMGIHPAVEFGEDKIVNASIKTKFAIRSMLKSYKKSLEEK